MALDLVAMGQLQIIPSLIVGVLIGLIETVFVAMDEGGMGWFKHAAHAFPFAIVFAVLSMNVGWALGLLNLGITENFAVDLAIRALIAIVAIIKIKFAAAIAGSQGESWIHVIIIGILLLAAPYLWAFVVSLGVIPGFLLLF